MSETAVAHMGETSAIAKSEITQSSVPTDFAKFE